MSDDNLPLFTWQPPRRVIPFPTSKRVGKIQRVAEVLERKRGRDADHYWRQVSSGMQNQMAKANIPREIIEAEMRAFLAAVQRELERRAYQQSGRGPGAA